MHSALWEPLQNLHALFVGKAEEIIDSLSSWIFYYLKINFKIHVQKAAD